MLKSGSEITLKAYFLAMMNAMTIKKHTTIEIEFRPVIYAVELSAYHPPTPPTVKPNSVFK